MFITKFYNNLSPFKRVILALMLGILTGIFVGEPAGQLEILGTAYIRLLQMTVLPYVLVSIIGGLGRLDSDMAGSIGSKAVKIILVVWFAVMLSLLFLPLAYPTWETSGFFSSSLIADKVDFNFVDLYIPANIFSSLANTIVPAVVLFSLLMGVALINVKNKETLLALTSNIGDSLMGVASFVAKLAPLGIFAISASAAGTLHPEELGRLQIFLYVYLLAAFLFGFLLLPLIIHWATPFTYRQVLTVAGEAVVTAFATGTVLVVLPMIAERCKEMLAEKGMQCKETDSTVDVIVPTAYSFPSTGTLLGLGFILFSAWYVGSPLSIDQYLSYVTLGALTAFGSMAVAIPFLLDFFGLPADQFQLYLLGSVVTARFATALAALHGFVITLMVASAVLHKLKWSRLFQAIGLHLVVMAIVMIGMGITLKNIIFYEYEGARTFEAMTLMNKPAPIKKLKELLPLNKMDIKRPRLDVIRERGSLRIGYFPQTLPYAFVNDQGNLVGFDMELMHQLAHDINIKLEYIRLKNFGKVDVIKKSLANGSIDILIGGRAITPLSALDFAYSDEYTYHSVGLVLYDSKRDKFTSVEAINSLEEDVKFMIPRTGYYKKTIENLFPNATIVPSNNARAYFKTKHTEYDALIFSSESGAAWSMLYPKFTVVIPEGLKLKAPVGFAMPKGEIELVQFMNTWINLKQENGEIQDVYNYWILGENPKAKKVRWSIMRDVLGNVMQRTE